MLKEPLQVTPVVGSEIPHAADHHLLRTSRHAAAGAWPGRLTLAGRFHAAHALCTDGGYGSGCCVPPKHERRQATVRVQARRHVRQGPPPLGP
jgi:hypothetical protein